MIYPHSRSEGLFGNLELGLPGLLRQRLWTPLWRIHRTSSYTIYHPLWARGQDRVWQGHFNLLHRTFIHLPGGPTCLTPLFSQPQRTSSSSSSSSILLILSFKMYLQRRVRPKAEGKHVLACIPSPHSQLLPPTCWGSWAFSCVCVCTGSGVSTWGTFCAECQTDDDFYRCPCWVDPSLCSLGFRGTSRGSIQGGPVN